MTTPPKSFSPQEMAAMLTRAFKNWPQAVATMKLYNEIQESMPRWQATMGRVEAHEREHRGQPLPSDISGELSTAIALLEQLEAQLDKLFGSDWPEQNRAQFATLRTYREALRKHLQPQQN